MKTQTPFKRLILRAVLRKVSPMVIRVLAVPDYLDLASFDEVFRSLLGWDGLGFSFHIHGQEFTSFLRRNSTEESTFSLLISLCAAYHAQVHRLLSIYKWIPAPLIELWVEQHPDVPLQLQMELSAQLDLQFEGRELGRG